MTLLRLITHFDPDGDLKILAGTEKDREIFIVSSKAMSLACKPWKAMVGPDSKFIEGTSSADAAVPLPDDDIIALKILLNVAHLRFSLVPDFLSFEDLLQVAIICDKYDAAELVQPWLQGWLMDAQTLSQFVNHEGWLFISWTFGLSDLFRKVAQTIASDLEVVADSNYTIGGRALEHHHMPPGILGMMNPKLSMTKFY